MKDIKRIDSKIYNQGKNEKIKNKFLEGIKYGVILNKK